MSIDVELIKRKMLVKYPLFGSIVVNLDYKEDKEFISVATDGKVVFYNPEYFGKLSINEQISIFAHEICHIAFNHILRGEGKDLAVWNIATDAVINAFLERDGLIIKDGVHIADAINYDADQLYEKLLQEEQQNEQEDDEYNKNLKKGQYNGQRSTGKYEQRRNQSSRNSSLDTKSKKKNNNQLFENMKQPKEEIKQNVGRDSHSLWKDSIRKLKEEKVQERSENEKKQEEFEQLGEKEVFRKNLEERKKELEDLKKVLSMQTMGIVPSTNKGLRDITDIGKTKPLIDWRYALKEATLYGSDWSYNNAIIEDGVISANLEEYPMTETEVVLDISGSINEILLKNFLRECKNILQYSRLKVGCFDTEFYGFHEIRTEEDIERMKFVNGGGTDFDVAVGAFSRRVGYKIIFTDGKADMPNMFLNAIWIVFGEKEINPKGGKVIRIDDEQLDRLYSYQEGGLCKKRSR